MSDAWIATRCLKPKTLKPLSPPTTKTTNPPLKTFPALRVRFSKWNRYHIAMFSAGSPRNLARNLRSYT